MRVCILTKADTLSWTQHYVDAFRERAEVITVGPGVAPKQLEDWDLGRLAHTLVPNDVETELHPDHVLRELLPDGWKPDLVVAIANGGVSLRPAMESLGCPTAYITVDTWQSISDYVECQQFDFVFAVQKDFVQRLRAVGGSNVYWLPLGCNPAVHHPADVAADHDVAFVGNVILPFHQQRYDLLERLEQHFSLFIASKVFREDLCRATARGRLAFNRSAIDDVNMRVFEVMAMGRPLLTNRDAENNGLMELFEEGTHVILYADQDDLIEKTEYYLAHEQEREAIARAGMELVTTQHRYLDRVDTMLTFMRDRIPSLHDTRTPISIDDAMANLVPFGAARIVDAGGRLSEYAATLHARGAQEILNVEVARPACADVLGVESTSRLGGDCRCVLDRAYGLLTAGGTLILRLTARDFSTASGIANLNQLENVFAESGFHITQCIIDDSSTGNPDVIVRARKRTRRLADIVRASCDTFPHLDADGLMRWAAAYGPEY